MHALLVPCDGEPHCFEVSPAREAGFSVPLAGAWIDASHTFELANGVKVEAVAIDEGFELIAEGLGSMPVSPGATCRTQEGSGAITCGVRGRSTIGLLEPGLPSTTVDARGAVVEAGGKFWFVNSESVASLDRKGQLLAIGEPMDFHTGVVQLAGQCDQALYQAARDTAGQCFVRTPINIVYAGVDLRNDGSVHVDASHVDPVHEACMRDVLQRELASSGCQGSVALRYVGPGYASSL